MSIYIYSLIFYFVILLLSTNIIGFIVNGFYNPLLDTKHEMSTDRFIERTKMDDTGLKPLAIGFTIFGLIYLYTIYYYLNIGITIVAFTLMLTRIPNVRFEMRTNTKVNGKNIPKNGLSIFTTIIDWLLLPAIFFSLKYLEINNSWIIIK